MTKWQLILLSYLAKIGPLSCPYFANAKQNNVFHGFCIHRSCVLASSSPKFVWEESLGNRSTGCLDGQDSTRGWGEGRITSAGVRCHLTACCQLVLWLACGNEGPHPGSCVSKFEKRLRTRSATSEIQILQSRAWHVVLNFCCAKQHSEEYLIKFLIKIYYSTFHYQERHVPERWHFSTGIREAQYDIVNRGVCLYLLLTTRAFEWICSFPTSQIDTSEAYWGVNSKHPEFFEWKWTKV